ncbi:MAG TPA: hypothetical protein VHB54_05880 [Mucilaginibacter sp.]|nr:hypothetical protein [Mucilaginibacter sp.]
MTNPENTVAIPGLLQNKILKKVVFTPGGLTIKRPMSFGRGIFIRDENIAAFRFGIKQLYCAGFEFGSQYFIEVRDFKNEIFRIQLNSYFGIRKKIYYHVWADLLQTFWDHYIDHQLNYYIELYNMQMSFELAGVTFYPDGISFDKSNKLRWNEIAIKSYQNYFMIHHNKDSRIYKCCLFSIEWNAVILQSLLKEIIKEYDKVSKSSSF